MEKFKFILLLLLTIGITGCNKSHSYFPEVLPPASVSVVRFDSAIVCINPCEALQQVKELYLLYPDMMNFYGEGIIGIPGQDTVQISQALLSFIQDTTLDFHSINATVLSSFEDISFLRKDFTKAFTRIQYFQPDWEIPTIYCFVSGFNLQQFYYHQMLGIGLDRYLGSDYPLYDQVAYQYQQVTMSREYIVRDAMLLYLSYHIPYTYSQNRLLDRIVHSGKQLFILSQLLSPLPDSILVGYSAAQYDWCIQNEAKIWNTVMDRRALYSTESRVLTSYLQPAPFTAEISSESPGRLGDWLGYRIVEQYMRRHSEVTLSQLLSNTSSQHILEQSMYQPR